MWSGRANDTDVVSALKVLKELKNGRITADPCWQE